MYAHMIVLQSFVDMITYAIRPRPSGVIVEHEIGLREHLDVVL